MKKYSRRLTYSEVKYGYLRIEKDYADQCPKPGHSIRIKCNNYDESKKTHSTQIGRIDGLTELYKKHNVETGYQATIEFADKDKITISFNQGEDLLAIRQEKKEKKELLSVIDEIRELISKHTYLFCRNETNVCIEIIEPILDSLGWNLPNLNREKSCHSKKADYALYKDGKCILVIEAKSIERGLNKDEQNQLLNYMDQLNSKFGILTNGLIWQVYELVENENNNSIKKIRSINIMPKDEKDNEIDSFFKCLCYNSFNIQFNSEEKADDCESINWNKPFKIEENGLPTIEDETPTQTFLNFIKRHFKEVKELQENNRFVITVVASKTDELGENPQYEKYEGLFINTKTNTYLKRMLIQQIMIEKNISATIKPILP